MSADRWQVLKELTCLSLLYQQTMKGLSQANPQTRVKHNSWCPLTAQGLALAGM